MATDPCGVEGCPAFANGDDGFCEVHDGPKRVVSVLVGTKCTACGRAIQSGDWLTRASTAVEMTHAVCPPPRPFAGFKKDRVKPLLDGIDAAPAEERHADALGPDDVDMLGEPSATELYDERNR